MVSNNQLIKTDPNSSKINNKSSVLSTGTLDNEQNSEASPEAASMSASGRLSDDTDGSQSDHSKTSLSDLKHASQPDPLPDFPVQRLTEFINHIRKRESGPNAKRLAIKNKILELSQEYLDSKIQLEKSRGTYLITQLSATNGLHYRRSAAKFFRGKHEVTDLDQYNKAYIDILKALGEFCINANPVGAPRRFYDPVKFQTEFRFMLLLLDQLLCLGFLLTGALE